MNYNEIILITIWWWLGLMQGILIISIIWIIEKKKEHILKIRKEYYYKNRDKILIKLKDRYKEKTAEK